MIRRDARASDILLKRLLSDSNFKRTLRAHVIHNASFRICKYNVSLSEMFMKCI